MSDARQQQRGGTATAPQPEGKWPKLPDEFVATNKEVIEPKRLKFEVLAGSHFEPVPLLDSAGNLIFEPVLFGDVAMKLGAKTVVRIKTKDIIYGKLTTGTREAGDIVETNVELDKLHNHPGMEKFRRLGDPGDLPGARMAAEITQTRLERDEVKALLRSAIEGMEVRSLIEYAKAKEIDVKNETTKEKLVKLICSSLGL